MFELKESQEERSVVIPMNEMEPCAIGVVCDYSRYDGHYVMRTASIDEFEVMDLSRPDPDACWDERCDRNVRLLPVGSWVTLTVIK